MHSKISSSAQNSTTGIHIRETLLVKQLKRKLVMTASNECGFSRSDNLALGTETRHTSKLCIIVSFEWFLMKCDAKASGLPSYLLLRCEIPTFFFQAKFVNMKSKGKNNTLSNLNTFVNVCKMNNR